MARSLCNFASRGLVLRRRVSSLHCHQELVATALGDTERDDFRLKLAPWLPIGQYEQELMTHLTTKELLRASAVLQLCRFDSFVQRSQELFKLSCKLRISWILRNTFFEQFVGGETVVTMRHSVDLMHRRGILLMLLPVVEADVSEILSYAHCEKNQDVLEDLIRLTATLEPKNSIFHLKVSAIIPTSTLKSVTRAILEYNKGNHSNNLASQARLIEIFSNSIDNPSAIEAFQGLTRLDQDNILLGLRRANKLGKLAQELQVQILVDAEFVSCKEAISLVAHCLMARFNGSATLIGNTTQAYLKGALATAANEWAIMQNIGVYWAGKVVRGAYMLRENEIARQLNQPSPVWGSYEATNLSYNSIIAYLLGQLGSDRHSKPSHLVVATHNERSIRLAAHLIKELNLEKSKSIHLASFAQIYGMADYLSTPLVRNGFPVYKSTPYGPMELVLPYLSRRAVENRSVIRGARVELEMLKREIKTRTPFIRALFSG